MVSGLNNNIVFYHLLVSYVFNVSVEFSEYLHPVTLPNIKNKMQQEKFSNYPENSPTRPSSLPSNPLNAG